MMNEYKQTLEETKNLQRTENGALGYSTTGQELVDLNFSIPSNHDNVSFENIQTFVAALRNDLVSAAKWLFYLRDVREGLGERDSFITLFISLYTTYDHDVAIKLLPLIPVYGRWKDVIDIFSRCTDNLDITDRIYEMVHNQLMQDCEDMSSGKSISLLAKWMPSINASPKARRTALRFCREFNLLHKEYRGILSALRRYLDVTEVKTCGGEWHRVDYNKVSSNANSRYVKAFMKHDPERRRKYLSDLASSAKTGAVMHASNLYPYEVYAKYDLRGRPREKWCCDPPADVDPGVEALWDNLKNIPTVGNTMVVCDGSGSMVTTIKGSNVMAINVARSLGVFFAERCEGEFHNKVIEFSSYPEFIDLSHCKTLADKYNEMSQHDDCSNTNLEKVFDLLLVTAIGNNLPQEELPQRLLIVSDMEFDQACEFSTRRDGSDYDQIIERYRSLFKIIKTRWDRAGYTMPEIVFWNVNSRTNTVPVRANEIGVRLVAGFSVNNVKLVLSGKIDPKEALMSVLDAERYQPVADALQKEAE